MIKNISISLLPSSKGHVNLYLFTSDFDALELMTSQTSGLRVTRLTSTVYVNLFLFNSLLVVIEHISYIRFVGIMCQIKS